MGLNKQKGNMYAFVTHTWNPIRGKCPHDCTYCYMKVYPQPELHFAENEMKTDLGEGNFIFVGSSCDMWAEIIPKVWIEDTLRRCLVFGHNRYLFQSKNPHRFSKWCFPPNTIFGTTIESNREYPMISKAPKTSHRAEYMAKLLYPRMVSIEPILDFDLDVVVDWIKQIAPEFVSIGADSKGHNLPEPSSDKVRGLIKELEVFTTIKIKDNLRRLI